MTEQHESSPPVKVGATGTILNPWYELPTRVTLTRLDITNGIDEEPEITPPCRVELVKHDLNLYFRGNHVILVFTGNSLTARYLINPIRYYFSYRTFINYNLISPHTDPINDTNFVEVDSIRFKVERIVRVEHDRIENGEVIEGFYHTGQEEWLEVAVDDLRQFLLILDETIYCALAFYLTGCANPRYFLIEFYKAVEVIKNKFGNENNLLTSLKPYGVTRNQYRDFRRICNDMKEAPLDIGRHAPTPEAPLFSIDLRNLLVESRSREVLESTTVFCRQVIDAYIKYLRSLSA